MLSTLMIAYCLWTYCPPPDHFSPEPLIARETAQDAPDGPDPVRSLVLHADTGMGDGASDVEEWRPLVAGQFSDLGGTVIDDVLCVMAGESGGNTHARNPRSTATGLMQVMASIWGPEFGFSRAELEVPEHNLYVARQILDRQGWDAWPNTARKCGLR